MIRNFALASLAAALLTFGLGARAAEPLLIGVPEANTLASMGQAVLRVAYERLGIELRPRVLPLRRSLVMAANGQLDGDLMRAAPVFTEHPTLLQVRVPAALAVYAAYKRGDCPQHISTAELARSRVSYFRGIRAIELQLPQSALMAANNSWDVLRLLQQNISDYALGMRTETDQLLLSREMQGICRVAEPVIVQPLYHALHERHAALVPRLEAVLTEMDKKGEIARIWADEERRALQDAAASISSRAVAGGR